ncbi:MAG: hypothetical protein U1E65_02900 [Myxococcota bacterium]
MSLRSFWLRLALTYALIAGLSVLAERPLLSSLLPMVRAGFALFQPEVELKRLSVEAGQVVAELRVEGRERRLGAIARSNGRTFLVGPILCLSVVAAWRFRSWQRRGLALLAGAGLCLLWVAPSEAHLLVTGLRQELHLSSAGRGGDFFAFFLENGGRQLLPLSIAALVIAMASKALPERA